MGAGTRPLFPRCLGLEVHSAARLTRSRRKRPQRRTGGGSLRQGHVHLHRLCILPAAAGRSSRRVASLREPSSGRTRRWRQALARCDTHESSSPSLMQESNPASQETRREENPPQLIRGMGLGSATSLNMLDMIGVGPFITMPLIVSAMGGPQAMLGWILGAGFAICDGLVWAELGAAMPGSGGSYRYLKEIYG